MSAANVLTLRINLAFFCSMGNSNVFCYIVDVKVTYNMHYVLFIYVEATKYLYKEIIPTYFLDDHYWQQCHINRLKLSV